MREIEQKNPITDQPGVYLHKNAAGDIIYVGKAKNLRKRVAYYHPQNLGHEKYDTKTAQLISEIASTETIVTSNEVEALLLENRLIKEHKPKYNIQLRDHARYSYIKFSHEEFPRLSVTRTPQKSEVCIGPFTQSVRPLIKIGHEVFNIRRCSKKIPGGCFYYRIGRCSGVCAGLVNAETYHQWVNEYKYFLTHGSSKLIREYTELMKHAAANLEFEKALEYRKRLSLLEQCATKQVVDLAARHDQDVIAMASLDEKTCIVVLKVRRGVLIKKHEYVLESASSDLLDEFIKAYYRAHIPPQEIIVPQEIDPALAEFLSAIAQTSVHITVPERGTKLDLIELAKKNAYAHFAVTDPVLTELKELLGMQKIPLVIDCFDISNYGESVVVGACVQYKNRKPLKQNWRLYNVRGEWGQDDFRSMHEVISRRYSTLPLPDLIVIDGGIVQLQFAVRALQELSAQDTQSKTILTTVIGLAKREETIIFPDGRTKILDRRTESAKLLICMRDDTHRFAIMHSRTRMRNVAKSSILDTIPDIGPTTKMKLLRALGSPERIKNASLEELTSIVGKSRAEKIFEYFKLVGDQ